MTAKYIQVKEQIMSGLLSAEPEWLPHQQLPSEHEMSEQFGVSRQTVRQALGDLVQDGWLYRIQGKGTFVAEKESPQQQSKTIGVVTTYISDYIFPKIVQGIESTLTRQGYRLLLMSTDNDKSKEQHCLEMLLEEPLSGVIIEPTKSGERSVNLNYFLKMEQRSIPYLMINARYEEMDSPCLRLDDELGGFMAAEHLIQLGHTRLAGFFKTDDMQGIRRMKGFIAAHRKYGIPIQEGTVFTYSTEEKKETPRQYAETLLNKPSSERPTGWVTYNDELAVHLLDPIRKAGLSVPGDLSMVGFDDSFMATATEVKLTTIAHPKQQLGVDAAEWMVGMIEKHESANEHREIVRTPELIVRESTRSFH
ncbi:GntR family transcriptional regulator [Paenibacillus sp. Marseille-Q4541]|uniref:GntR family transcriptional regulator n=1 Tax=Paenibacillus sp. Marseille-Q4541 TaxID=2831522 RepID=UPI001BA9C46C|nr:GntR family transcriptional regulator [Paenibacillus sp. Marseille-Q4541]